MALGANISPGQGEKYYQKDDYYLEKEGGEDHKLEWQGTLARELGLAGKADAETWKNALNGHFPGGIEIPGGNFKDGKGERHRRAGTDFEFSAPKSVSIQALVFGEDRLIRAHREAVSVALSALEEETGCRRGHAGKEWETTGKGLVGRVTHMTSRSGDPHLHDHVVFLNVTKNRDGTYQAMTNDRMLNYQRFVQEVYHAELSLRLVTLGYELEKGPYGEPQLKGMTREQIESFSQRVSDIDLFLKDRFGVSRKDATQAQKLTAWERTRETKKTRELDGLQHQWQERAREMGAEPLIPRKPTRDLSPETRRRLAREALIHAVLHHTERESAVKDGELLRTALQAGRGKIARTDMDRAFAEALSDGDLIRSERGGKNPEILTSREALTREKRILRMEKEGRGEVEPALSPFHVEERLKDLENGGLKLNSEQKEAVRTILSTGNRFSGINGAAGVGKTTMLRPAVDLYQAAGFTVLGLGPQHSAVHALKDAGIVDARTLQSWLADPKVQETLSRSTVVVIDEAGLASAKNVEAAMNRIERSGARAVFVGDVKQYESVDAGPAFRQLQNHGMETVAVRTMQRQKNAPENVRNAARLSVSDPSSALAKIEVREVGFPEERYQAVAAEILSGGSPSDTLCLTGTHAARRAVNGHVREALGLSGAGREFAVFEADDFTKAQRKRLDSYTEGQAIRFSKEYRSLGVRAGETFPVKSIDRDRGVVLLSDASGRSFDFTPRGLSGDGWEIGAVEPIELAPGDRIRITGNARKKEGITNGMKGVVTDVRENGIQVRFDAGSEAFLVSEPSCPLDVSHGYAQTGHSAQGLGAERVILDLPGSSRTVNRRSFYTNLTRTKNRVVAFTDNREALTGSVAREQDKSLAHDVFEKTLDFPTHSKDRRDRNRGERPFPPEEKVQEESGRTGQDPDHVRGAGMEKKDPGGVEPGAFRSDLPEIRTREDPRAGR